MRKSFVALSLVFGAALFMANLAVAQMEDPGNELMNAKMAKMELSRAMKLGTASGSGTDTTYVGHSVSVPNSGYPWFVGRGPDRPFVNPFNGPGGEVHRGLDGTWNWDEFNLGAGENDSLQGWWPIRRRYTQTGGLTYDDTQRPWWCLDFGNQVNYVINSGNKRTFGVTGVWHVDGGSGVVEGAPVAPTANLTWTPITGNGSAWCGLRAANDNTTTDSFGGTGNPFNQTAYQFYYEGSRLTSTATDQNFPGYGGQWDQLLYHDYRCNDASGANTVQLQFKYVTRMSTLRGTALATRSGWFDQDPTSTAAGNFISSSVAGTPVGGGGAPIDSFMVYVGVPVNPTSYQRADGSTGSVYDLKRRWFSEVIALDAPYTEVFTTFGDNSGTITVSLNATTLSAMLGNFRNPGAGGVIRVAFRSKTGLFFDDGDYDSSTPPAYAGSGTAGAVRIDDVSVTNTNGGVVKAPSTTTFELGSGDIDNTIEAPNAGNGGSAVSLGQGYALSKWHSTGKPPDIYFHNHPLAGGDIDGGVGVNNYSLLEYHDLCGSFTSDVRQCNLGGVVASCGNHDDFEAAGGTNSSKQQFVERSDGFVSPTVNMWTQGIHGGVTINSSDPTQNNVGLDADDVILNGSGTYRVRYEMYAGIYNLTFQGNSWQIGAMSWPATQTNGVKCWGNQRYQPSNTFNPDPQCFFTSRSIKGDGSVQTSNANTIPDSIRVLVSKIQRCFSFAVTTDCSPTGGTYFDNISMVFVDPTGSTPGQVASTSALGSVFMNFWDTIQDCFPTNESVTPGVSPALAAGFDTCAAVIQTGLNIAQSSLTTPRFVIAGDTILITSSGAASRVDMVFRVKPGPGNFITLGNRASGLRAVPSSVAPAGPSSFWGAYMAANGAYGSGAPMDGTTQGGGHSGSWKDDLWNSARCDTAEFNIFPVAAKGNLPGIAAGTYSNTLYDGDGITGGPAEPKFAILGSVKNRCFLIDTTQSSASVPSNVTCGTGTYPPVWATTVPASRTGYRGGPGGPGPEAGLTFAYQTKEYTKIIPDGLLTPGAHVEYFFRKSELSAPAVYITGPDTETVAFQAAVNSNFDQFRWCEFSVLPDRWKDAAYGGSGQACMLFVDWCDRRGPEGVWVGVADSIGATAAKDYGAHNGFHAAGDFDVNHYAGDDLFSEGLGAAGVYQYDPLSPPPHTSPGIWKHGGQAGTMWDMYGVRASESVTTSCGSLGARIPGTHLATGLAIGKDAHQGPTPLMLRTYYSVMLLLTGDLNSGMLGPYPNRSGDDQAMVSSFINDAAGTPRPRGVWVGGDGFVQAATLTHFTSLLGSDLGVSLRDPSYQVVSGTLHFSSVDLLAQSVISAVSADSGGDAFGVDNNCTFSNDLLTPNAGVGAVASMYYQNPGIQGTPPFVAGVFTPSNGGSHNALTLVDGFDIQHVGSRFLENDLGRNVYMRDVLIHTLASVFGSACAKLGSPAVDVPQNTGGAKFVNFMNLKNNPFSSGMATVAFGLAKSDRVDVRVYDVTGRLVRTLANHALFAAGPHTVVWDGTNDAGQSVSRGVYFTQIKSGSYTDAKKLTVLK